MKKPQLSDLTLREKIAQCLCIVQSDLNNKNEFERKLFGTPEEYENLITDEQYGCIWCRNNLNFISKFRTSQINPETNKLSEEYDKDNGKKLEIPLLCSIDGETEGSFSGLTPVCPSISLGATDDVNLAYELAVAKGKELKSAGINWEFGPVVDISSSYSASVSKTYSQNPDKIIEFANAQIKGLQSVGVAAAVKNFPGGDRYEYRDLRFTSAKLFSTMEEWWSEQGKIFQNVIDGGVCSVMTSHKSFPACDDTRINGKHIPATLSKKVITDLLKGTLGFEGVVVTDCINTGNFASVYPHNKLIVEIMKAGNDMILGCEPYDADILEKAVLSGELPESRINDAVSRILDMKEKIGLFENDYTTDRHVVKKHTPAVRTLNEIVAKKSITLVRDNLNIFPLDKKRIKNIAVICVSHLDSYVVELSALVEELEKRNINVNIHTQISLLTDMEKIAEESDVILYMTFSDINTPKGGVGVFAQVCETLHHAFSFGKEKSIAVSTGYPYMHYNYFGNAETFINTYTHLPDVMRALVRTMFGEIPFEGKSPVKLVPETRIW